MATFGTASCHQLSRAKGLRGGDTNSTTNRQVECHHVKYHHLLILPYYLDPDSPFLLLPHRFFFFTHRKNDNDRKKDHRKKTTTEKKTSTEKLIDLKRQRNYY